MRTIRRRGYTTTAFGADSVIELIAGGALLWQLYVEASCASLAPVQQAERTASWVAGSALLLLVLCIAAAAAHELWVHSGADISVLGILLSVASGLLMPVVARAKKRIGSEIGSKALRADGSCSMVSAYMAWTVLAGVTLTALFGWWWVDGVSALALLYFVVQEGWEAIQAARGVADT